MFMPFRSNCRMSGPVAVFTLALTLVGSGCITPGLRVEWLASRSDAHIRAGAVAAAELERSFGGVAADSVAYERVARVGERVEAVMPALRGPCHYAILRSERLNALSLPSGKVYLTQGLYERLATDDLLAAALAHELAHIVRGDGLRACTGDDEQFAKECAADRCAFRCLAAAGYDTEAVATLLWLLENEQKLGWARARVAALRR